MNIKTALYEFTVETVDASAADAALYAAVVHPTIYAPFKESRTVRIYGVNSAAVTLGYSRDDGSPVIEKRDGRVFVFFCAKPESQKIEHLVAAERLAEQMADEWALRALSDTTLGGRLCKRMTNPTFTNRWIMPQGVLIAVAELSFSVNPI